MINNPTKLFKSIINISEIVLLNHLYQVPSLRWRVTRFISTPLGICITVPYHCVSRNTARSWKTSNKTLISSNTLLTPQMSLVPLILLSTHKHIRLSRYSWVKSCVKIHITPEKIISQNILLDVLFLKRPEWNAYHIMTLQFLIKMFMHSHTCTRKEKVATQ